jgi:prepilin-type N-terminal cleavage/methylation domain-containing protein
MRSGSRGFTLLEVAIALAILGVGVVTVLELFSAGLHMEGGAGQRARAVVYARGLLDQTLALPELRSGSDRGRFDDVFRWEVTVREAPEFTDQGTGLGSGTGQGTGQHSSSGMPNDLGLKSPSDLVMYDIEVAVLWRQAANREGAYTVHTLRLTPRNPT